MWSKLFSQAIADSFESAKKRNDRISLRKFAQQLGAASGMVSEIISEKRVISFDRAMEICVRAGVSDKVISNIRRAYEDEKNRKTRVVLSSVATDLILNVDYYRLLCSLEVLPNPSSLSEIAKFLKLGVETLKPLVRVLEELEIVSLKDSKVEWKGAYLTTPENIASEKIQAYHRKNIEDSAGALALPITQREFTSVIFAGSEELMENSKKMIRALRDDLPRSMRGAEPDGIYQLSVQLRPLSQTYKAKGAN